MEKILYKEEEITKINKEINKWKVIDIISGIIAISLFILFICLSTYEFNLIYKIFSSFILSIYSLLLVYSILEKFIKLGETRKHLLFMLISEGDTYKGIISSFGEEETTSERVDALPICIKVEDKEIIFYCFSKFASLIDFKEGDKVEILAKSRFLFSYKIIKQGEKK